MATTMKDMGLTNAGWGVCGFTSTFYAMWQQNPTSRGALMNAPRPFTVLAEIKQYLKILQAAAEVAKLQSITDFTRSFGKPHNSFTVEKYIERINKAVAKTDQEVTGDELFGIAMPPQCVADYARRIWGFKAALAMGDTGGSEAILGVKSSKYPKMTEYNGLCHYLYRANNHIYSWGHDPYASVTAADATYSVVWKVTLTH
jgi:hypothetical protein